MDKAPGEVVGCEPVVLSEFHIQELFKCLDQITTIQTETQLVINLERFEQVLSIYTNRLLLFPIIPKVVDTVISHVKLQAPPLSSVSEIAFSFLELLSTYVGFTNVARYLDADVKFLARVLEGIEYYSNREKSSFPGVVINRKVVNSLLVWLYIIIKNPFDLNKVGVKDCNERIEAIFSSNNIVSSKILVAITAQLYTRNQNNITLLTKFFDDLQSDSPVSGVSHRLKVLCSIFKIGKKEELTHFLDKALEDCNRLLEKSRTDLILHLSVKLLQRICLVLLPLGLAQWRYTKANKSILQSLSGTVNVNGTENDVNGKSNEDKLDDRVLSILSNLESFLKNDNNSIRWSAAKGLSRILARLPCFRTENLVSNVIKQLDKTQDTSFWNGVCLLFAELTNRGCITPSMIPDIIKVVKRALVFDYSSIKNTTETNVRDSACYICWSIGRSYPKEAFEGSIEELTFLLVCTALFDRDVNIRRAASATFQEHVGRHGGFSHGIQVLVIIDFTAVALLPRGYSELAEEVAEHREYLRPIMDYLVDYKTENWNVNIRELTAGTLSKLSSMDKEYSADKLLPRLTERLTQTNDFECRHGLLLAISSILKNCDIFKENSPISTLITFINENCDLMQFQKIEHIQLLIKGISTLITALIDLDLVTDENTIKKWLDLLISVLESPDLTLRDSPDSDKNNLLAAISAIASYHHRHNNNQVIIELFNRSIQQLHQSNAEKVFVANVNVLGSLSNVILSNNLLLFKDLCSILSQTILTPKEQVWVSSRIISLLTLVKFNYNNLLEEETSITTLICLNTCLRDQTKTKNGDIGSYVRKAAICNSEVLLSCLHSKGLLTQSELDETVGRLLSRLFETVRNNVLNAQKELASILSSTLPVNERNLLEKVCQGDVVDNSSLTQLLSSSLYRGYLFESVIQAIGSTDTGVSTSSFNVLHAYLKDKQNGQIRKNDVKFMDSLIVDLNNYLKTLEEDVDEQIKFYRAIQKLAELRVFECFEQNPSISPDFVAFCELIIQRTRGKGKVCLRRPLLEATAALMLLEYNSTIAINARKVLLSFLRSSYSVMRSSSAQLLNHYLSLSSEEIYDDPKVQEAFTLLTEHNWSLDGLEEVAKQVRTLLVPQEEIVNSN